MPRKPTSPWEFGELFPPEATRQVLSVTELTVRIRSVLEQTVGEVWVSGELTNVRVQGSGHCYFTLKDPSAQLNCVLFRTTSVRDRSALKDGQRVILHGEITVYELRGQYQLIVRAVELAGIGALQMAFERLKQKLKAEGLFEPGRKRAIPRFPRWIGIVTSPSGAALQDILHVIERRFAGVKLLLAPCRVQGQGAELEIAAAVRALNEWSLANRADALDVIVVTRGGGSLEDLWAFNEEAVARAIASSAVPVVSAVGHEIDFTIADFVADLRAATPSAAAELLTAGYVEAREWVSRQALRLNRMAGIWVSQQRTAVSGWQRRLRRAHPRRKLDGQMQRLDEAISALGILGREALRRMRQRLETLGVQLGSARPDRRIRLDRERLQQREHRFRAGLLKEVRERKELLDRLSLRLRLLSPEHILARGYSITLDAGSGRVIRSAGDTTAGQSLRTRLHSGEVTSVVKADDATAR